VRRRQRALQHVTYHAQCSSSSANMMNLLKAPTSIALIRCLQCSIFQHIHGTWTIPCSTFQGGHCSPLNKHTFLCVVKASMSTFTTYRCPHPTPITTLLAPCLSWPPSATRTSAAAPLHAALSWRSDHASYDNGRMGHPDRKSRARQKPQTHNKAAQVVQQQGDHVQCAVF
jgi:hypothetical protein